MSGYIGSKTSVTLVDGYTQAEADAEFVAKAGDGSVPAGAVIYQAANTAPTGFIKANGASLSTTTYANLFAAIGYTFGGSGSSFNVPDLRGEFIRAWDDARGVDSGRSFGSAQSDAFQGHWHQRMYSVNRNVNSNRDTSLSNSGENSIVNDTVRNPVTDGSNGTPRTASETRPRNIALLACIKY